MKWRISNEADAEDIIEKESAQESAQDSSYLMIHDIPIRFRADILLFLCQLKSQSQEFSKFVKKVQKEESKLKKKVSPSKTNSEKELEDDKVFESSYIQKKW